jgi:hypothetical protein
VQTESGAKIMGEFPAWKDMTDQQKFDFLHEWCANMSRQIDRQGAMINDLYYRLSEVDKKTGGVKI